MSHGKACGTDGSGIACEAMFQRHVVMLWLGFCVAAVAEEAAMHRLRVLAVGDPPPFVQEVRDGARREVAPPEGSIPPRSVTAGGEPLRIRLGRPSSAVMLPVPGDGRVEQRSSHGDKGLDFP